MSEGVPIEFVRGIDSVTVWMWPNTPDPVQLEFDLRKWARIERQAEREMDGDLERYFGSVVDSRLADA